MLERSEIRRQLCPFSGVDQIRSREGWERSSSTLNMLVGDLNELDGLNSNRDTEFKHSEKIRD